MGLFQSKIWCFGYGEIVAGLANREDQSVEFGEQGFCVTVIGINNQ